MAAAYTIPEAVCLKCGRAARPSRATLDPSHPMVLCSWPTRKGRDVGCGVQLGTLDPQEGAEVARWNVTQRGRTAHLRHLADRRPGRSCALCPFDPPSEAAHHHADRLDDDRFALFVHLDLHHGDRSVLVGMHRRTIADLRNVHDMHHGRPFRP